MSDKPINKLPDKDEFGEKYRLAWDLQPKFGEFSREELDARGLGGCDALILFSLIYPEDGSFSMNFWGIDGRKSEDDPVLHDNEIFKVWSLLAHRLAGSKTLDEGKREFAELVFETHRAAIMANREQGAVSDTPVPAVEG